MYAWILYLISSYTQLYVFFHFNTTVSVCRRKGFVAKSVFNGCSLIHNLQWKHYFVESHWDTTVLNCVQK